MSMMIDTMIDMMIVDNQDQEGSTAIVNLGLNQVYQVNQDQCHQEVNLNQQKISEEVK